MPRPHGLTRRTPRFLITRTSGPSTGLTRKRSRRRPDKSWRNKFMAQIPITMPQLGESMAEATIVAIKVQPGDKVSADQEIIEIETDKAVMGVTTPCAGEIAKIDAE